MNMSIISENDEIGPLVNRMLDNLSLASSSQVGVTGVELRRKIGNVRAFYSEYLRDGVFASNLLACFTVAREGNAKLSSFVLVREQLLLEVPVGDVSKYIVQVGIGFCLGSESRTITEIEFTSRDDVEAMMATMKIAFDKARELAADVIDSASYQNLTFLAGALTSHLVNVSRPLPRMVTFKMNETMPALAYSQRVYYTADRAEEIVAENHVIHPAFVPAEIRGLAS